MRAPLDMVEELPVGHQAHAQSHASSHADSGHAGDQVTEQNADGSADAWSAVAIISVVVITALFWLTGHAG
jgi:hypothetical protein